MTNIEETNQEADNWDSMMMMVSMMKISFRVLWLQESNLNILPLTL